MFGTGTYNSLFWNVWWSYVLKLAFEILVSHDKPKIWALTNKQYKKNEFPKCKSHLLEDDTFITLHNRIKHHTSYKKQYPREYQNPHTQQFLREFLDANVTNNCFYINKFYHIFFNT